MDTLFYAAWYSMATLALGICVWLTRSWRSRVARLALCTLLLAIGFTTMTRPGPDGGLVSPVAVYYGSRGSWLEAVFVATGAIGTVWLTSFLGPLAAVAVLEFGRREDSPPSRLGWHGVWLGSLSVAILVLVLGVAGTYLDLGVVRIVMVPGFFLAWGTFGDTLSSQRELDLWATALGLPVYAIIGAASGAILGWHRRREGAS